MTAKDFKLLYFDPQRVGEDLSEVALEMINVENQEIESHWYHSQYDTDLFIWANKSGEIIKQQLSYMGQVVEWNFVDGIKTGIILEDEIETKTAKASEIIKFDNQKQNATLNMAIQIIEYSPLKNELKESVLDNFKSENINMNLPKKKKTLFQKLVKMLKKNDSKE